MKKIVSMITMLVMVLLAFGNLCVYADDVAMSAYLDVLNGHRANGATIQYVIYDIDRNNVPELIIRSSTCEVDEVTYFYTFYDGHVVELGKSNSWGTWYKAIPGKKGLIRCQGRIMIGELISVVNGVLYIEDGYEYGDVIASMVDVKFIDKTDLSGFGNFNYVSSNQATGTSYRSGIEKGIDYYNKGMYYEAIDEIQWYCDANWYNMTVDQQKIALDYLGNAKSRLAEYLFTTGRNYYNNKLYYEAKSYLENAIEFYKQLNYEMQWKTANDYLYNTNEEIKALENWIWVNPYYFDFIGKTRTQVDNALGPITETVWDNVPYYRHKYDGNALFIYDKYVGFDYMAASYANCCGVETTVGSIVGVNNNYNNIEYGLREVFTYDEVFQDEATKEWCCVFYYKNYVIMTDWPNISLKSRVYIYKR